jgi:hypothetical protein
MPDMKRFAVALTMLLSGVGLAGAATVADAPRPEFGLTASGDIQIGTEGQVLSYQLDPGLSESVQALVEKSVARWRFEPILVDGRPAVGRTRMNLEVDALPAPDGGYRLTVANVWFGSPRSSGERTPPGYPKQAVQAGLGARVMLIARIDATGRVVDVHPYQTSLSMIARSGAARRFRQLFEARSIAAVKRWTFSPGEMIGGVPLESTVKIPIVFSIAPQGAPHDPSVWRGYVPGPITPAPWVDENSLTSVDTDALGDGEAAALDSRFRLVDDIRGEAL